ncbi:MAG: SRPBCC family protein [Mycobacterium sp.]
MPPRCARNDPQPRRRTIHGHNAHAPDYRPPGRCRLGCRQRRRHTSCWFPSVQTSEAAGGERHCVLAGGAPLDEEIVTSDDELCRFQYRIVGGGLPVAFHLGTIDVLDQGDRSLVIYSTEIDPDEVAGTLGPAIEDGLRGLKMYCESGN